MTARGATHHRRALLTAALGFCAIEWHTPTQATAAALHRYIDSWRGLGLVVDATQRRRFKAVHLSTLDDSTVATVATVQLFVAEGFGTGATPWRAMQIAAIHALNRGGRAKDKRGEPNPPWEPRT